MRNNQIPKAIREMYFSDPKFADVRPAKVSLLWNGIRVKLFDPKQLHAQVNPMYIANHHFPPKGFDGMILVTAVDDHRPFERDTTEEARAGGAPEKVSVKTGAVHITELGIGVEESHEEDTYLDHLLVEAMKATQKALDPKTDERDRSRALKNIAEIVLALATGDYEPLYLQYMAIVKENQITGEGYKALLWQDIQEGGFGSYLDMYW